MKISQQTIAEKFGVHQTFVSKVLRGKFDSAKAIGIRIYADEVGYVKQEHRPAGSPKPEKYYWNGNFHTKEDEVARMKELREEGYSNAEIAKKIGRGNMTVFRAIGSQPAEMTAANVLRGVAIRTYKNQSRKAYVKNLPIVRHNAKVRKLNAMMAEANALKAEIIAAAPSLPSPVPAPVLPAPTIITPEKIA